MVVLEGVAVTPNSSPHPATFAATPDSNDDAYRGRQIHFDASRFPLCRVTFPEQIDDAAIPCLFARTRELFARRQRFVLLVNASNAGLTARQRKLMVSSLKEEADAYERWIYGSALVVRSALARGTVTALMWMMNPPYEQKVVSKLEEGEAWAYELLRRLEERDRQR